MKLKMAVGLSGPTINLSPGDESDFPHEEALRLIKAGYAVAIEQPTQKAIRKRRTTERRSK